MQDNSKPENTSQGAAIKTAPAHPVAPTPPTTMADLAKQLLDLQKQINEKASKAEAVTRADLAPHKPEELDWSKITEKDIFNMSVPIPAIEQEVPDYLNIHVKDQMYITRWIHKMPERLGPCLVSGYSYVTEAELDPRYPLAMKSDVEGHFCYSDVVCMKILKSRYFPALRRNHEKSMAIHGKRQVRGKLENQISNSPKVESAIRRGAISFYDEETTEESGPELEAATL